MSVSNSTNFNMTAAEVVLAARSLIGIQASEEPLAADELQQALQFLNMFIKTWQADGVRTWTLTEGSIQLVQGVVSYAFGAGGVDLVLPFDMDDVRIFRSSVELQMLQLSRQGYFSLPNKTSQGYPTQYYYNRQRDTAQIYVWPAPDSQTGVLNFTYRRVIDDIDNANDDLDLPQEWLQALTYNLALELIPQYGKADSNNAKLVVARAAQLYSIVKNFDTSEGLGSVRMTPTRYRRGGARNS